MGPERSTLWNESRRQMREQQLKDLSERMLLASLLRPSGGGRPVMHQLQNLLHCTVPSALRSIVAMLSLLIRPTRLFSTRL